MSALDNIEMTIEIRSYGKPTLFLLNVALWFMGGPLWPIGYAIAWPTPLVYRIGRSWHVIWIGAALLRRRTRASDAAWEALEQYVEDARRYIDGDPNGPNAPKP